MAKSFRRSAAATVVFLVLVGWPMFRPESARAGVFASSMIQMLPQAEAIGRELRSRHLHMVQAQGGDGLERANQLWSKLTVGENASRRNRLCSFFRTNSRPDYGLDC